jgi:hypothetical protein
MRHVYLALVAAIAAAPLSAQQLGTKVMGALGIDAGTQGPPGLYILDRLVQFDADRARGQNGETLPIQGLDILARANALGVAYAIAPRSWPYLTFAASVPYARISINSDDPVASIDRWGLSDLFVQPIKAGWREPRYDVVAAYAFFAPTGKFEPRGTSVGRGYWTHQVSTGGAWYSDTVRTSRASALVSFEFNQKKRGIDITRGNMLTVQGGAGTSVRRVFVVGVAGYALWQVSDDRGSDLPPTLTGLRTRTYGLGPEVDFVVPSMRLRGEVRYEWDLGTRARPQGNVLGIGLTYRAWAPTAPGRRSTATSSENAPAGTVRSHSRT